MNISVIICAYSDARWETLVAGIEAVRQQRKPAFEIIAVIDNNTSLAMRVRERFRDIHVIEHTGPRGLNRARNAGVAAANGDILAFIDDDALAEPDWLKRLSHSYADAQVLGVGGSVLPVWSGECPGWFPDEFYWVVGCSYRGQPETAGPVRNFIGCNMSFRRTVFEEVGYFSLELGRIDAHPLGCEETELCIRIQQHWPAHYLHYDPLVQVRHIIAPDRAHLRYFLRRCYYEGCSKALVTRLVGMRSGLASERSYSMHTLPHGILRNIRLAISDNDPARLASAGAIMTGLCCAIAGYIRASF